MFLLSAISTRPVHSLILAAMTAALQRGDRKEQQPTELVNGRPLTLDALDTALDKILKPEGNAIISDAPNFINSVFPNTKDYSDPDTLFTELYTQTLSAAKNHNGGKVTLPVALIAIDVVITGHFDDEKDFLAQINKNGIPKEFGQTRIDGLTKLAKAISDHINKHPQKFNLAEIDPDVAKAELELKEKRDSWINAMASRLSHKNEPVEITVADVRNPCGTVLDDVGLDAFARSIGLEDRNDFARQVDLTHARLWVRKKLEPIRAEERRKTLELEQAKRELQLLHATWERGNAELAKNDATERPIGHALFDLVFNVDIVRRREGHEKATISDFYTALDETNPKIYYSIEPNELKILRTKTPEVREHALARKVLQIVNHQEIYFPLGGVAQEAAFRMTGISDDLLDVALRHEKALEKNQDIALGQLDKHLEAHPNSTLRSDDVRNIETTILMVRMIVNSPEIYLFTGNIKEEVRLRAKIKKLEIGDPTLIKAEKRRNIPPNLLSLLKTAHELRTPDARQISLSTAVDGLNKFRDENKGIDTSPGAFGCKDELALVSKVLRMINNSHSYKDLETFLSTSA